MEVVRYFTARVRDDADGEQRQSDYLDALRSHSPKVVVKDGRFQEKSRRCRDCGNSPDLRGQRSVSSVRETKSLFPTKRIIVAFPPNRHSAELKRVVDGFVFIGDDKIRRAQLPDEVVTEAGVVLRRPKHWASP